MSTPKSKARTLGQARRAANKVHRDKKVADSEYMRREIKEHSEG